MPENYLELFWKTGDPVFYLLAKREKEGSPQG